MSDVMCAVPENSALMRAWREYQESADFQNALRWSSYPEHRVGSLWASFLVGWNAAIARAAAEHENIDPASGSERVRGAPGADAMGAVIEYRDAIRSLQP
jgi:hypothetical protein